MRPLSVRLLNTGAQENSGTKEVLSRPSFGTVSEQSLVMAEAEDLLPRHVDQQLRSGIKLKFFVSLHGE